MTPDERITALEELVAVQAEALLLMNENILLLTTIVDHLQKQAPPSEPASDPADWWK